MRQDKRFIAVDLGAESGRVMLGILLGQRMRLEQVYRFDNRPLFVDKSIRWNFDYLFSQVLSGLAVAMMRCAERPWGIGVDSWGVDFGLLDEAGRLIEQPCCYRDSRTNGMMERAFELMDKRLIYQNTGLQFLQFNTIYQLLAMRLAGSESLTRARHLVFMADLLSYHLCGEIFGEYTLASTSQLMNMRTGWWAVEIFDRLSLPLEIMPDIVPAGTVVGRLNETVREKLRCEPIDVIAVASHDTASAVAAVPASGVDWAFLSSGTWSLMGVELNEPIINDRTFRYGLTNEGGFEGKILLLKNITGLWLLQECRRQWQKEGFELSYDQLVALAESAEPFTAFIDPDYHGFLPPGDMPGKINHFLAERGQKRIADKGRMVRTILEGLAFKYRWVMERLEEVTGRAVRCLHVVGGGIKNELLCQFASDATGKLVIAGPVEATATGNILIQAKATGLIKTLDEARAMGRNSFGLKQYRPRDVLSWQQYYKEWLLRAGVNENEANR